MIGTYPSHEGAVSQQFNDFGQPIGFRVQGWQPRPRPSRVAAIGSLCRIEPLDCDHHAADLFAAYGNSDWLWTYMAYGPFATLDAYRAFIIESCLSDDPLFYSVVDRSSGRAMGVASYMRIDPLVGTIEVGGIMYSPGLQRTAAASESMYLLMRRAFDELGYRRYEWKCDALNGPSRAAALRLGFQFEGIFRQATIYKGRNRDTAWFSITNRDWPALKSAFERWLAPGNFDAKGNQTERLSALTRQALGLTAQQSG
jgi:RimJ/RimL family protein N-acetyltransferase